MNHLFLCRHGIIFATSLLILAAALGSGHATASTDVVTSLYNAEILVDGRDETARRDALRRALANVMVKVGGQINAPFGAGEAVLADAESLVSQYRFEALPEPESDIEGAPEAVARPAESEGFRFVASFVPGAVNAAMAAQGIRVWPARRPRTLAFVVLDGRNDVVTAADANRIASGLVRGAEERGIPLLFPRGDFDERAVLDAGNVWAVSEQPLRAAASRYQPSELLVVRVTGGNGDWRARATRMPMIGGNGEPRDQWSRSGNTVDSVLLAVANSYADQLAGRYTQVVATGPIVELNVLVTGIKSFGAHADVINAITALSLVNQVVIKRLTRDANVYAVRTRATSDQLRTALAVLPELSEDRYASLTLGETPDNQSSQESQSRDRNLIQGGNQPPAADRRFGVAEAPLSSSLVYAYSGAR